MSFLSFCKRRETIHTALPAAYRGFIKTPLWYGLQNPRWLCLKAHSGDGIVFKKFFLKPINVTMPKLIKAKFTRVFFRGRGRRRPNIWATWYAHADRNFTLTRSQTCVHRWSSVPFHYISNSLALISALVLLYFHILQTLSSTKVNSKQWSKSRYFTRSWFSDRWYWNAWNSCAVTLWTHFDWWLDQSSVTEAKNHIPRYMTCPLLLLTV